MNNRLNEATDEFIARIYCDLGKNVLSIGVASFFFKDMPLPFRIGFGILGLLLIIGSIYVYRNKGAR